MVASQSLFSTLKSMGLTYRIANTTRNTSFKVGGFEVAGSSDTGVRYTWSLTNASNLSASFCREELAQKLTKVFKKELQVGDPSFDDTVYIVTSDQHRTAAFLDHESTRDTISDVVQEGGRIIIRSNTVVYEIIGDATEKQLLDMGYLIGRIAEIDLSA